MENMEFQESDQANIDVAQYNIRGGSLLEQNT